MHTFSNLVLIQTAPIGCATAGTEVTQECSSPGMTCSAMYGHFLQASASPTISGADQSEVQETSALAPLRRGGRRIHPDASVDQRAMQSFRHSVIEAPPLPPAEELGLTGDSLPESIWSSSPVL